jgi:uncharacterized protein (UPF0333 family)
MIVPERDSDGRAVSRVAAANKGATYLAHPIEMETSKLSGCYSKDYTGTDRNDFSMRFYNSSDVELTAGTQVELDSNCVKTVITWKPAYDYELVGGNMHQITQPTNDIRLWVIGGMFDPNDNPVTGYVAEFAGGINMAYFAPSEQLETDGRASKFMAQTTEGAPYPTNTLQFIIRHNTGDNHKLKIVLEYFR